MVRWLRTGKAVSAEGTTIEYSSQSCPGITLESRRRHIPHSNGIGTWDHTTYHVLKSGEEVGQYYSLRSAQEHAERMVSEKA